MIEVSSLVALVVVEVIVGLLVLSGLLLLFTLLRKGRIRKAAAHLAERVKTDRVKREERLKTFLEERYQLKDAELEQALHNMIQTEMILYQNVINGFLKDDQLHLQQIDVDVENLVLSYQGLDLPESAVTPTQSVGGGDDVAKLKEENERLSEELRVTMDTMGRMLNEYSTMFADGENAVQAAPSSEAPEASEQVDVAIAETRQDETEQAPMEQPTSIADADATIEIGSLDEMGSDLMNDTEIPDLSADELEKSSYLEQSIDAASEASESAGDAPENASLADDAAEADEEVSEIIDEVMEMADEMIEDTTQADKPAEIGESMVDDLEKIDIEIPDADGAMSDDTDTETGSSEEADADAASLEEEWAKLLEEDAENKKQE
jgi:hypothetical protein